MPPESRVVSRISCLLIPDRRSPKETPPGCEPPNERWPANTRTPWARGHHPSILDNSRYQVMLWLSGNLLPPYHKTRVASSSGHNWSRCPPIRSSNSHHMNSRAVSAAYVFDDMTGNLPLARINTEEHSMRSEDDCIT